MHVQSLTFEPINMYNPYYYDKEYSNENIINDFATSLCLILTL